jgi:hypothetical protein
MLGKFSVSRSVCSVCQPSLSHQLPRLFVEEELAKCQVLAHQVYHGQARTTLLIDHLCLPWGGRG